MERRKQIEIEEQEIRRKEKELMSTVKLPAEAEAYKVQTIAEGKRFVCILYYKLRSTLHRPENIGKNPFAENSI